RASRDGGRAGDRRRPSRRRGDRGPRMWGRLGGRRRLRRGRVRRTPGRARRVRRRRTAGRAGVGDRVHRLLRGPDAARRAPLEPRRRGGRRLLELLDPAGRRRSARRRVPRRGRGGHAPAGARARRAPRLCRRQARPGALGAVERAGSRVDRRRGAAQRRRPGRRADAAAPGRARASRLRPRDQQLADPDRRVRRAGADRRRHRLSPRSRCRGLLLASVGLLALFGAGTAMARTLAALVVWQAAARMFQEGALFTSAVIAAEEMPAAHRGTAQGLLGTVNALGSGFGALLLSTIDRWPGGWRGLCLVSLTPLVLLPFLRRAMPESRRWLAHTERARQLPPPAYRGRMAATFVVAFLAMSYDIAGFSFATYVPITRYGWSPGMVSAMFIVAGGLGLPG